MIDLSDTEKLCRGLAPQSADALSHRAAVALERRHQSGVRIRVTGRVVSEHELRWESRSASVAQNEDDDAATADGAMCIALAIADRDHQWRVIRRIQSGTGERADWLMEDDSGAKFALEIKGTDDGPLPGGGAIKQARDSILIRHGVILAACVIRFREPKAIFDTDGPR